MDKHQQQPSQTVIGNDNDVVGRDRIENNTYSGTSMNAIVWIGLVALVVSIVWWGLTYYWITESIDGLVSNAGHCLISNDIECKVVGSITEFGSPIPAYTSKLFWISIAIIIIGIFLYRTPNKANR